MSQSVYCGIRISAQYDETETDYTSDYFQEFVNEYYPTHKVFGVFENPLKLEDGQLVEDTNPHYHFMLIGEENSDAFSKRLKRYFVKANEAYADKGKGGKRNIMIKTYDEISKGYFYLCKGELGIKKRSDPVVVINNVLSENEIMEYHNNYWNDMNNNNNKNNKKDDNLQNIYNKPQKAKSENYELIQYFINTVLPKYKQNQVDGIKYKLTSRIIMKEILTFLRTYRDGQVVFKQETIYQKYNMIMNKVIYENDKSMFDDWEDEFINNIMNRFQISY